MKSHRIPGTSLGEEKTRKIIELITRRKWPRSRPKWLGGLELDLYNKKLKVAVEFNGDQHYRPSWGEKSFKKTLKNDLKKKELCGKNSVKLFSIDGREGKALYPQITEALESLELSCPNKEPNVRMGNVYGRLPQRLLQKLHDIAEKRGGKCLNTQWAGAHFKYTFISKDGNKFLAAAYHVTSNGRWCPLEGRKAIGIAHEKRGRKQLRHDLNWVKRNKRMPNSKKEKERLISARIANYKGNHREELKQISTEIGVWYIVKRNAKEAGKERMLTRFKEKAIPFIIKNKRIPSATKTKEEKNLSLFIRIIIKRFPNETSKIAARSNQAYEVLKRYFK